MLDPLTQNLFLSVVGKELTKLAVETVIEVAVETVKENWNKPSERFELGVAPPGTKIPDRSSAHVITLSQLR